MGESSSTREGKTAAHVAPLFVFMLFLLVPSILEMTGFTVKNEYFPWYRRAPEQWLYPLQTLVGLVLLARFWKHYDFRPVTAFAVVAGTLAGLAGIALWILPGYLFRVHGVGEGWPEFLGFTERLDGFDPSFIEEESRFWYAAALAGRFLRMVVVVSLVEEIFWRGFLMRYLLDMDGDFWKQPFGRFQWRSYLIVTAFVTVAHAPVDYAAAFVYGSLAYGVAVWTKSLFACVWMHAVANLTLGIHTLLTGQWGYW